MRWKQLIEGPGLKLMGRGAGRMLIGAGGDRARRNIRGASEKRQYNDKNEMFDDKPLGTGCSEKP
jgi:hypothetical protein